MVSSSSLATCRHRWELPGYYPVLVVLMVTGEFLLSPFLNIRYMIINRYNPGEPVKIHIQLLINIIQDNNRVITTKKNSKGKLPLFCGNGELVNSIYACRKGGYLIHIPWCSNLKVEGWELNNNWITSKYQKNEWKKTQLVVHISPSIFGI